MFEKKSNLLEEFDLTASWESRRAYAEGNLPLHFEHIFDGGEILLAEEKDGLATIVLKRGGKVIYDFSELLAKGTKFITPSFFKKQWELADKAGFSDDDSDWEGYDEDLAKVEMADWSTSPHNKYISIGDWRNAKDLLILLHEIGHTHQDTLKQKKIYEALKEIYGASRGGYDKNFVKPYIEKKKELIKEESEKERGAWVYALKNLKKIEDKTGVNLKSLFHTTKDAASFIEQKLRSHRRQFEFDIGYGFDQGPEIKNYKQIFQRELLKYFDRPVRK